MTTKSEQAKIISGNIKGLRSALGWNQSKLASESGVTAAALSKIEKGEERIPTIVVLRKLSNALRVQITDITGEESIELSASQEKEKEFYRRFGVLEDLHEEDQKRLLDMASRLKDMGDK